MAGAKEGKRRVKGPCTGWDKVGTRMKATLRALMGGRGCLWPAMILTPLKRVGAEEEICNVTPDGLMSSSVTQ